MRLTIIGRNPQEANIVLNSQYISNYHAEIIQLDNGDMFLVDKSTNGTFLNGNRLTPGKEVAVKRGDNIMFADVALNWSLVEEVRVPRDVKQIKSIGSHYMNSICVQGPNVSRFHATVRQMSDGKWYICDHSKNGTTVNGSRLQKNRYERLKKGDEIICAGVPVQNPIPGKDFPLKWLVGLVAAACIGVLGFFMFEIIPTGAKDIYKKYSPMVAWVSTSYHFEVSCPGIDMNKFKLIDEFCIEFDEFGDPSLVRYNGTNSMRTEGTGFFIGDQGHMVTNRHVARPWETLLGQMASGKSRAIEQAEIVYREYITEYMKENYPQYFFQNISHVSKVEVKGVVDDTFIVPNGFYPDSQNAINCHEVACGTIDEDLALLQIRSNFAAMNIKYIPFDALNMNPLEKGQVVYTIGFPHGFSIQNYKTVLEANCSKGDVSRTNDQYQFGFTAPSYHGASGSPVFDNRGKLVGVLNAGIDKSQGFNYAIRSKYLYKLLQQTNLVN